MSCVEVMYQPYAAYFPYQRPGASATSVDPLKKFSVPRVHDPFGTLGFSGAGSAVGGSSGVGGSSLGGGGGLGGGGLGGGGLGGGLSGMTGLGGGISSGVLPSAAAGSPTATSSPSSQTSTGGGGGQAVVPKEEASDPDTKEPGPPQNTQYMSANCVILTYFAGDIAANVDEHFTRALSQPNSFTGQDTHTHTHTHAHSAKAASWKDVTPLSQRNFPPSFWNSSYQPPAPSLTSHPAELGSLSDPYSHMTSSFHGVSSLQDPWRYPLTSQTHNAYASHGMHDALSSYTSSMAAAASGSSRFNHYSSFLPGSHRFASAMSNQCDPFAKHTDSWGGRYTDPLSAPSTSLTAHHDTSHLHSAGLPGGIETAPLQDSSKDLYWY